MVVVLVVLVGGGLTSGSTSFSYLFVEMFE